MKRPAQLTSHVLIKDIFLKPKDEDQPILPDQADTRILMLWALVYPEWKEALENPSMSGTRPPGPVIGAVIDILEKSSKWKWLADTLDDTDDGWGFEELQYAGGGWTGIFQVGFSAYPDADAEGHPFGEDTDDMRYFVMVDCKRDGRLDPKTLNVVKD